MYLSFAHRSLRFTFSGKNDGDILLFFEVQRTAPGKSLSGVEELETVRLGREPELVPCSKFG